MFDPEDEEWEPCSDGFAYLDGYTKYDKDGYNAFGESRTGRLNHSPNEDGWGE